MRATRLSEITLTPLRLVTRYPYHTAVPCAAAQFALTVLIFKAGLAFAPGSPGAIRMTVFASTILFPIVLAQVLGAWGMVGLDRVRPTAVFFASLLTCGAFLARGLHATAGDGVANTLALQFLNAFGEELLFRGVIFAALASAPLGTSILLSGVSFGSMHLIHGVMEGDWGAALTQAAFTTAAGWMFAAVRADTGSLWLAVLLHMLLNLSIIYSNLEPAAGPATYFAVARVVNVFECALALYVVLRGAGATRHQTRQNG